MKRFKRIPRTLIFAVILFLTDVVYFLPVWKDRMVPFPGHLLVSFFSPWKEEQWPGYSAGVPRKGVLGFDPVRMMGPWRHFVTQELKQKRLPTWSPYQFGGAPMLANGQSGVFFPLSWVYLVLPFPVTWTLLMMFQPIIAAFSMWLFLRSLGHKNVSSGILSLCYAFSAWMSVWIGWNIHGFVYALLPLGLMAVHKKHLLLGTLVLSLFIFAGHPQAALIGLTAVMLYGLVKRRARWTAVVFALALVASSIQWFPMLRYYFLASREYPSREFSYRKTLLTLREFAQLLSPNINGNPATENYSGKEDFVDTTAYVGISLIGFALISLTKSPRPLYPVLLLCSVFVLVTPNPLSFTIGALRLPIIATSVASRWLLLWPLGIILLAAGGMDVLLKKGPGRGIWAVVLLGAPLMILWVWALTGSDGAHLVARRNLVIPTGIAMVFASGILMLKKTSHSLRPFFVICFLLFVTLVSLLELMLFAWKTMTYTESRLIYPEVPVLTRLKELSNDFSRFASSQDSVVEANFATQYELYDLSGYDALYPRRIGALVWAADNGGTAPNDFSRSTIVVPTKPTSERNRLWDLAGVRWILHKDDFLAERPGQDFSLFPPDRYRLVWEQGKWQIYENLQAFPRAFFMSDATWIGDGNGMISRIYSDHLPPVIPEKMTRYDPASVDITVDAPADGYVVLTDTFYPGWRALVDGKTTEIRPAFQAFRAVSVSEGKHKIEFTYQSL